MSESEFSTCDSEYLKKLLEERDEKEKLPYENLIYTINEYVSELESALILVDSMKMSLKRTRLTGKIGGGGGGGGGNNSLLETKLKELKDERAELYRQQGIQATHLLSLNDQMRSKDTQITSQLTEISQLKAEQERKEEEMKKLKEKLREGEEAAKIIGDELVALQLELLRLDQWQNKTKNDKETLNDNESNVSLNISTTCYQLKLIKEKEIIAPHQYPISSYTSQPKTRQLLTGSEDQKIILYDLTRISTKMVLKWSKINGPIVALAVDGEGKVAASCSAYDKEVTIWNLTNGKIQSTLQFTDDSNDIPLLKFGSQFRLWMSLGRSVRLWDVQRGLLLRSWNKDSINQNIQIILPDAKRPDRLWCVDENGSFAVLNAVNGKLEVPWKPIITNMEISGVSLYDCNPERIVLGRMNDKAAWIITGYGRNPSDLDGIYEFNLKSDLKCDEQLRNLSIHPDRNDLLALILENSVLIVKVSQDNWNPETLLLQDCRCDTIQWGPEEDDPINGEKGCKIVLIDKESKQMKLFTLSSI